MNLKKKGGKTMKFKRSVFLTAVVVALGLLLGASTAQATEVEIDELMLNQLRALGYDLFGAFELEGAVLAETPESLVTRRAADVQVDQVSGTPQLLIQVDREAIARYGLNVADVQQVGCMPLDNFRARRTQRLE